MADSKWVTHADREEVARTRRGMLREAARLSVEDVARVDHLDADGVPVRVVEPHDPVGTLVFFHGGGFAFGEPDTHEPFARRLANRTGRRVLIVDYRRSPEHAFPAAVRDTDTVCDWLVAQASGRLDQWVPLTVVGDSAGANLALHAAVHYRQLWAALVLVYPYLDPTHRSYDHEIDAEFSLEDSEWFWKLYLQGADPLDPLADPLREPSFAGLPRTLLQLAELDILTPTGWQLARRLTTDGVEVQTEVFAGVPHGFWRRDEYPESEAALQGIAQWLGSRR